MCEIRLSTRHGRETLELTLKGPTGATHTVEIPTASPKAFEVLLLTLRATARHPVAPIASQASPTQAMISAMLRLSPTEAERKTSRRETMESLSENL